MSATYHCFFIKGDKFTDPIDGKVSNRCCRMDMKHSATMSFHKYTFFRDIVYCGCTSTNRLIFLAPKVLHFAPEQAFYKLFRKQKT
jgi:hypothetical protein